MKFHVWKDCRTGVAGRKERFTRRRLSWKGGMLEGWGADRIGHSIHPLFNPSILPRRSPQHTFHHMPMDIREAALDAVVVVAEAFVIEAQQMQHGGVEIIDGGHVLDGFPAEVVS